MKQLFKVGLLCGSLAAFCGTAQAEYRSPSKEKEVSRDSSDRFSDAVNLSRFRKGNTEWDTQELIVSGLTALHEENVRILNRLDRIESRLGAGSDSSSERNHGS